MKQVKEGVWQLEVESTKFPTANEKKPLIGAWRATEREVLESDKAEPKEMYYDAFESQIESTCRIL